MRTYLLIVLGLIALAISVPASMLAHGEQVTFIVAADIQIQSGETGDVGIVTGRPLGVMASAGSCQGGHDFPVQQVIFVHARAGRSIVAAVVVLSQLEPLSAGTQLTEIGSVDSCLGPGDVEYRRYYATVR
jgi:hypothetical protein